MATSKTQPNYNEQARDQLAAQKNVQLEEIKRQLAEKLAGYNTQKDTLLNDYNNQNTSLTSMYQGQTDNQNLQNTLTKNNYNNNTTARGLGRSTVYTSGIAGLDDKNARVLNNIETNKNTALGSLTSTYNTNKSALDSAITRANEDSSTATSRINNDFETSVSALARQLQSEDWERNFKEQQKQLQEQQALAEKQHRENLLAWEKEKFAQELALRKAQQSRGYSSGYGSSKKTGSSSKQSSAKIKKADTYGNVAQDWRNMATDLEKQGDIRGAEYARNKAAETLATLDGMRYNAMQASGYNNKTYAPTAKTTPKTTTTKSTSGSFLKNIGKNLLTNNALSLAFKSIFK